MPVRKMVSRGEGVTDFKFLCNGIPVGVRGLRCQCRYTECHPAFQIRASQETNGTQSKNRHRHRLSRILLGMLPEVDRGWAVARRNWPSVQDFCDVLGEKHFFSPD